MNLIETANLILTKQNEINALINELLKEVANVKVDGPSVLTDENIKDKILNRSKPSEFDNLKALLFSNQWPAAVNPELICNEQSEIDKQERALGIIAQTINKPLNNLKVLDFGCAEGHTIPEFIHRGASLAVGYDIVKSSNPNFTWENLHNQQLLTTDFNKVIKQGPYDVILLYDVIDHTSNESIPSLLAKVNQLSKLGTRIYIRCHPFISRHGGHLYQKLNKAFAHVVFSEDELKQMGYQTTSVKRIVMPQIAYSQFLNYMPWKLESFFLDRTPLEPFFLENASILNRILVHFGDHRPDGMPKAQMEQDFLDYIYTRK